MDLVNKFREPKTGLKFYISVAISGAYKFQLFTMLSSSWSLLCARFATMLLRYCLKTSFTASGSSSRFECETLILEKVAAKTENKPILILEKQMQIKMIHLSSNNNKDATSQVF